MTLNKEEFKTLVMHYAANIDVINKSEEVNVMLEEERFRLNEKMFTKNYRRRGTRMHS